MKLAAFCYFLLSGVTWVAGRAGQGVMGRMAVPDPLMLGIIVFVLVTRAELRVPRVAIAAFAMVATFSVGVAFRVTADYGLPLITLVIHVFLVAGFVALYNIIVAEPMEGRIRYAQIWVRAAGIIACIALWDLVAPLVGLPGIAASLGRASRIQGGAVGTFRNTGQAGIFFVTAIATAIPLQRVSVGRARREIGLWFVVLALATIFTVKRSALIALAIMILLFVLRDRGLKSRIRSVLTLALAVAVVIPAFLWLWDTSPSFRWRINSKLSSAVVEEMAEGEGFVFDNVDISFRAFAERPFTGVGLSGVAGVYSEKYEIHSTYLSVLAESGLIGVVGYLWFLYAFFSAVLRTRNADPRSRAYARLLLPGLVGLFAAYAYTNHLRKREFWITAALASAMAAPVRAPVTGSVGAGRAVRDPRVTAGAA